MKFVVPSFEHALLDELLHVGGCLLCLAAFYDVADNLVGHGGMLHIHVRAGLPAAAEMGLVGQHQFGGGTAHLAIDAVLEGVGAVLVGHDHDHAVAGQDNLGIGILAVGTVVLELGVAAGLTTHNLFLAVPLHPFHRPCADEFTVGYSRRLGVYLRGAQE